MASEITYAEVKFKNESNSSGTYSESPAAPREKHIHRLSKPGSPSLPFISLMVLLLVLAITFLVAFIIYLQLLSRILQEKSEQGMTEKELSGNFDGDCIKSVLIMAKKVWSCCPEDWKPFGSHCYLISTVTSNNSSSYWMESEENCSRMGAHLVVIHSQEEEDFITGILNTRLAYFIGLWDTGGRQWRWVDQTPYNESATFWHRGEPNNDNEQCVILNHRWHEWGWNDIPCSHKQESVCQMKKIYL
ncbi:C-type lectin domain family 4 member A-like isoform X1 [Grammomys surdaster]|uniref:C-type lectin domain family 4 member A-like isoform X1 n=1 Tax=Grammomys surdaster TaxID=491861 RepID=UPI00109F8ECF|nr:C-type lectin domain family 4 member A-like isoform X1 [Grammomys surdaster]